MFKWIKRHPIVTAAAVIGGIYLWSKRAGATPQGQAVPQPSQGGGASDFEDVLVLQPGGIDEQMPRGGEIVLQLPLGAAWDQGTPVSQAQGSSIGGSVDPMIPKGAEDQRWTGVTGQGTIVANWIDAAGNPQQTTIAVMTS